MLNHVYRVIYNQATGCYVAVSEITKSAGKTKSVKTGATTAVSTLAVSKGMNGLQRSVLAIAMASVTGLILVPTSSYAVVCADADTTNNTAAGSANNNSFNTACGTGSTASGAHSTASGAHSTASGTSSTALGAHSTALGFASTATGIYSTSLGDYSTASGAVSTASGESSTASGAYTGAVGESSVALGGGDQITASGSTPNTAYDNLTLVASKIDGVGRLYKIDSSNQIHYEYTDYTYATSSDTAALSTADNAIAIGQGTHANIVDGVALGAQSRTTVDAGVAGHGANGNATPTWQATHAAVSVGDTSDTDPANWKTRQITGVAAGAADTDAVNVAQLQAQETHYVSINSTSQTAGSNYNNNGATGTNAIAIGRRSTATDASSMALGESSTASGGYSTATGVYSTASGDYSTALGESSTASGESSTASGNASTASGSGSTASGVYSKATGTYSTATGAGSTATGAGSTATGASSKATGARSVATGASSKATGASSTATGDYSMASGLVSTASGALSTASGTYSTASGVASMASGNASTASGNASTASGEFSTASGTYSTASGARSTASGAYTGALGASSVALGGGDQIAASGSTTNAAYDGIQGAPKLDGLGRLYKLDGSNQVQYEYLDYSYTPSSDTAALSTSDNAIAIGRGTHASIENGVALGAQSRTTVGAGVAGYDASTGVANTSGTSTWQATHAAVSVGNGTTVTRQITGVAAGLNDTDAVNVAQLKTIVAGAATHYVSINDGGVQAGNYNNDGATGDNAIAIGSDSTATGSYSTATGANSTASGAGSTALGEYSMASGKYSTVSGASSKATSDSSTASGYKSRAYGERSTATGGYSTATGGYSTATGVASMAAGEFSTASGHASKATGDSSTALGYNSTATGAGSTASGKYSTASGISSTALGGYTGAVGEASVALGGGNQITASGSTPNTAYDQLSATVKMDGLGRSYKIDANNQVQYQFTDYTYTPTATSAALSTSDNAIAIGRGTHANIKDGVALGSQSRTTVGAGVAGYDASTGVANTSGTSTWQATHAAVAVGNGTTVTRQITGIAAGLNDTDAVNVAQLKTVAATTNNAVMYDDATKKDKVTLGGIGAVTPVILTNVAEGTLATDSSDAVNGGQLFSTNDNVNANATTIGQNTTSIITNTNNIALKVNQTDYDAGQKTQDDLIATKAATSYVDSENNAQDTVIATKVVQADYDAGQKTQDDLIATKATTSYVDSKNNAQDTVIATKVVQADYNAGQKTQDDLIATKAATSYVDSKNNAQDTVIATKVAQTDYDASQKVQDDLIATKAATSYVDSKNNAQDTVTATKVAQTDYDAGQKAQDDLIATKVDQTVYTTEQQAQDTAIKAARTAVVAGQNSTVTADTTTGANGQTIYTVASKDDVVFTTVAANTVTTGYTVLNTSGITIDNGTNPAVTLTATGLDNGGNKILNVASGTADTDAVNVAQLNNTANNAVMYDDAIIKDKVTLGGIGVVTPVTLTNVAEGTLATDSSDAVNGGQLFSTNNNVSANATTIGQNTTSITTNTSNIALKVNQTDYDAGQKAQDDLIAAKAATSYVDSKNNAQDTVIATKVDQADYDASQKAQDDLIATKVDQTVYTTEQQAQDTAIKAARTEVVAGQNTTVTADTTTGANGQTIYTVATKDDVVFKTVAANTVTTGNTVLNTNGISVIGGSGSTPVTVSATGLDNGSNIISNVATGVADTDAVNVAQLNNVANTANNAVMYDNVIIKDKVTLGGIGAVTPVILTNVAEGTLATDSSDAVNGGQLFDTNNNVSANAAIIGQNTTGINDNQTAIATKAATSYVDSENNAQDTIIVTKVAQTDYDASQKTQDDLIATKAATSYVDSKNNAQDTVIATKVDQTIYTTEQQVQDTAIKAARTEVAAGQNTKLSTGTAADGHTVYTVATKDDVVFTTVAANTVTTGNTVLNTNGISITDRSGSTSVTVSATGLNNGGNIISNIATGVADTDAVNVAQLNNIANTANNAVIYDDSIIKDKVTLGGIGAITPVTLINVAEGTLATDSSDAVNGGQLFSTNNNVSANATTIGQNTTSITTNTSNIALKGNQTDYDAGQKTQDDLIATKAATSYVDSENNAQDTVIATKVAQTDYDASQKTQDDLIATKVDQTVYTTEQQVQDTAIKAARTEVVAGQNTKLSTGTAADGHTIYTVATKYDVVFTTVTTGNTLVNDDGVTITNASDNQVSLGMEGLNNGNNTISNVSAGVKANDAVNVNQLNQAQAQTLGYMDNRVNDVEDEMSSGIASAIALAYMPTSSVPGSVMITGGTGYFNNKGALAVGITGTSDSGKMNFKLGGSYTQDSGAAVGIGVGYRIK